VTFSNKIYIEKLMFLETLILAVVPYYSMNCRNHQTIRLNKHYQMLVQQLNI